MRPVVAAAAAVMISMLFGSGHAQREEKLSALRRSTPFIRRQSPWANECSKAADSKRSPGFKPLAQSRPTNNQVAVTAESAIGSIGYLLQHSQVSLLLLPLNRAA